MVGPWQAFERDIARLLIANGFDDVRIVAGPGDHGGDVIGVQSGELWVFQCKHTTNSLPPREAISEVVAAAEYYSATHMVVAVSRPPSQALLDERARYARKGLHIHIASPDTLLNQMAASPEYSPRRRTLHDYQESASDAMRRALLDTGKAQAILATGLGKTVVMAELTADLLRDQRVRDGRVLVVAHMTELVSQLHRSFWFQLPKWISTQQLAGGETPKYWDGVTFATIQSVLSRIEDLPPFGLVLIDEAHHIGAESFQRAISSLDPPMLGGVTATPWRGDSFDIDRLLGPPLVRMGIAEGLSRGFLSQVDYRLMADNLDWEFVQENSAYRYSLSQLNRRLILPTRDEEAVKAIRHCWDSERRNAGIVFSPTIVHAKGFAALLRRYGFRAEEIDSEMPPRERDKLMSHFRAGALNIVVTVDLFNEGVDVPDVDFVIFMRATHSRRIFVQQLGRGLRIAANKNKVVVLDFVTDLRRIAEVLDLDRAVKADSVEHLGLGGRLVEFTNQSAGSFLHEWLLDQASLILREGDPQLDLPRLK